MNESRSLSEIETDLSAQSESPLGRQIESGLGYAIVTGLGICLGCEIEIGLGCEIESRLGCGIGICLGCESQIVSLPCELEIRMSCHGVVQQSLPPHVAVGDHERQLEQLQMDRYRACELVDGLGHQQLGQSLLSLWLGAIRQRFCYLSYFACGGSSLCARG